MGKYQKALDTIPLSKSDEAQIRIDKRNADNIKKYFYISKHANPNERSDGIGYGEQLVLKEYALETRELTEKEQAFIDDRFKYYVDHPTTNNNKER